MLTIVGESKLRYLCRIVESSWFPLRADWDTFDAADAFDAVPDFHVIVLERGERASRVILLLWMVDLTVAV